VAPGAQTNGLRVSPIESSEGRVVGPNYEQCSAPVTVARRESFVRNAALICGCTRSPTPRRTPLLPGRVSGADSLSDGRKQIGTSTGADSLIAAARREQPIDGRSFERLLVIRTVSLNLRLLVPIEHRVQPAPHGGR
jgi:hypothetical protein